MKNPIIVYKVGMELYAAAGRAFVQKLRAEGRGIFLDLESYDIPETVKRATARVAEMGVDLLTIQASYSVLRGAVEGRGRSPLRLLGVTKAREAGMDGIVCSPLEAAAMRALLGPDTLLDVPGIRSAGVDAGDRKRVSSGRQITRAADPRAEAMRILEEIG